MREEPDSLLDTLISVLDSDNAVAGLHGFSTPIKTVISAWQAGHEGQKPSNEVLWEICALDVLAVSRANRSKGTEGRFRPLSEWVNPGSDPPTVTIYPDVDGLLDDKAAIDYYRQRAEATPNPIRKARYADIAWVALTRKKNREAYRYGLMAADAYLAQIPLCIQQSSDNKANIALVEAIDRAAEISRQMNNADLAARVVQGVTSSLRDLPEEKRLRWVLEMGDTLDYLAAKFPACVTLDDWRQVSDACAQGIEYFENAGLHHLAQDLMRLASQVSDHVHDQASSWAYQVQVAESLEEEASEREANAQPNGGKFAAYVFKERALHTYQWLVSIAPDEVERMRIKAKIADLTRESRRLMREMLSEMQRIGVSVKIPAEALERMVAPLVAADPGEVIPCLCQTPDLLLDVEHVRQQAREAAGKFVFASLAGMMRVRDGRKVGEIRPLEGDDTHFLLQMDCWFRVHSHLLSLTLARLEDAGKWSAQLILNHLHQWEFLDEEDVPFLQVGVERYFAGDYISALHVLTPRVEHMLKSAFEKAGIIPVVVPNQRQVREQTFGDFLCRDQVRSVLGEGMWKYLHYVLVDERGPNLRNDVAHGWITAPGCHRVAVEIILFVMLQLTRLHRSTDGANHPQTNDGQG